MQVYWVKIMIIANIFGELLCEMICFKYKYISLPTQPHSVVYLESTPSYIINLPQPPPLPTTPGKNRVGPYVHFTSEKTRVGFRFWTGVMNSPGPPCATPIPWLTHQAHSWVALAERPLSKNVLYQRTFPCHRLHWVPAWQSSFSDCVKKKVQSLPEFGGISGSVPQLENSLKDWQVFC